MRDSQNEYNKLLKSFELEYDENYLTLNETEIAKLLQKKKEHSLKIKIDDNMEKKWELKQTLKVTEKDIKVEFMNV